MYDGINLYKKHNCFVLNKRTKQLCFLYKDVSDSYIAQDSFHEV